MCIRDRVGTTGVNNFSTLGNVSLYRYLSVTQPTSTFNISEWQTNPNNYCQNLGVFLASSDVNVYNQHDLSVYPNPVVGNTLFVNGKKIVNVKNLSLIHI